MKLGTWRAGKHGIGHVRFPRIEGHESIAAEFFAGAVAGLAVMGSVSARVLAVLCCFDRQQPVTMGT